MRIFLLTATLIVSGLAGASEQFDIASSMNNPDISGSVQRGFEAGQRAKARREAMAQRAYDFELRKKVDTARETLFMSENTQEKRQALMILMAHDPEYVAEINRLGLMPSLE